MVTSLLRKGSGFVAIAILVVFCFSPAGFAALLVDFKSLPISPSDPEVRWGITGLVAAPTANGSQSNGDGLTALSAQTVGGLILETPLTINTATNKGGVVNPSGGSTVFSDVTMSLGNFNSSGAAIESAGLLNQPLGPGFIKFESTLGGVGGPVDLLVGNIANGNISGIKDSNAGSVLSGNVTYTGGLIFDKLNQVLGNAPGTAIPGGNLSFSLLDIDNKLTINGTTGRLSDFSANASGQLGTPVVPEPASIMLIGLSVIGLGIRRRNQI